MRIELAFAALLLASTATTYAETPSAATTTEKDCAGQLDGMIQSMETQQPTEGVDRNVNKVMIRILRKIQTEEGSCAALQALTNQIESNADISKNGNN